MKVKIDRRTLFGLVAEHCNIALSVRDFPTEITLEATPIPDKCKCGSILIGANEERLEKCRVCLVCPIPDTEECNNCGCLEMTHPIGECKEFVSKQKEPTEKHSCREYGWPKKDCTYCMNPKQKESPKKQIDELLEQESLGYFYMGSGFISSGTATPGQVAIHYARLNYLRARE